MPNYEAALAQLEKSKDNSGLPNWDNFSQLQNSKDSQKPVSGALPNFDLLLQQQLSQNSKESSKGSLLNWEALAQLQLPGQNSKESLKNLTPGIPNLDLLLQLQLSKDNSSNKNFTGWDALSLAQMQLSQGHLGKESQSKHQSSMPNFEILSQLQTSKESKGKAPHTLPNFEALALAQLQLAQGMKDSQNKTNIPNFETQMGQNLKESYSKNLGLSGIPNFEAFMQMQMNKSSKETHGKNFEVLAQMQGSKDGKSLAQSFENLSKESLSKGNIQGFEAFPHVQLNQGPKESKTVLPNLSFEGLPQFQIPTNSKDVNKSAISSFPNFEALALAQLQLSQGAKEKGSFGNVPNFEALAKFQMGQNAKEALKSLSGVISGYDDLQGKSSDWDSNNDGGGSKEKK